ncbi:MAG: tetratricopeptide repeat protein, partial [Promethearchaeota archaeon]
PNDSIGSPIVDLEVDTVEFYSILNKIINEEQNIETFEKNEESWVISYTPIGDGGYSIALIVPYMDIIESGINLQNSISAFNILMIIIFIAVLTFLFFIIIIAILFMSRRITRPITHLTDSIDNMVRGDLTKEIPIEKKRRSDEIGILAQSFQALLITMRLGNQSYYQGDIYLAYKNYSAALKLFKTTQNLKGQGICWNNLGNIFRNWAEFDKAKDAYDRAIEIAQKTNDQSGLSSRLNNRGLLFLSEGNFESAEKDFISALKLDEKMLSSDRIATRKRNLGVLYLLKNNLDKASKFFNEAINIDSDLAFRPNLAEDHFQIGRLELSKKNFEAAIRNLETAFNIAEEFGNYPLMMNILKILINIYDEQDNTILLHKTEAKLSRISDKVVRKKDVIFVIDQSGSMEEQNKIRAARKGASEVFDTVINPVDNTAIIGFHSMVNHILPLTLKGGNIERIQDIFKNLKNTPYQTAFYDALGLAVEMLKNSPKEHQKWIVALTDGLDNFSKNYSAITLAQYISNLDFPLNIILIGVGRELREVFTEMNLIVNSSIRGKYIPIYSEHNLSKLISDAFKRVKEIMASSEIEGFTPEEK